MRLYSVVLAAAASAASFAQPVETVEVVSKSVERPTRLPGDLVPFQSAALHARVTGFVDRIGVDRGSVVRKGQLLAVLSAPEMASRIAEAEAKVNAVEAQRAEAEARVVAAQGTWERLQAASATPGAVAGNDVAVAGKTVEAGRAAVKALESSVRAARASVEELRRVEEYLKVAAPFDGVVTERHVHPGALVGPGTGPLVTIEQHARLRLVVAVPEAGAASLKMGAAILFTVPAHLARTFKGTLARSAGSLDPKTRTMPVELDVENSSGELAPGMYAEVAWEARRGRPSLLVPPLAVVSTTERIFVIRVRNGKAEWVNVRRGASAGQLLEVFGDLKAGDVIVRRGSDEIREGSAIQTAK